MKYNQFNTEKTKGYLISDMVKKARKSLKYFTYRHIIPYVGLIFIKLISKTYRIRLINFEIECKMIGEKKRLLYACLHQRFFPGITFFAKRRPIAAIVSQSLDGEMLSKIGKKLGWSIVRGSSSRGGKQALEQIKKLADSHYHIAHIVDGPTGPFGKVKPGLIKIAQHTGIPIIPVIISPERRWVFNSWDRFIIPKPFSRIIIQFDQPIWVKKYINREEFEQKRKEVETTLSEQYKKTDTVWQSSNKYCQTVSK